MSKSRPSLKEKQASTEASLEGLNFDFNNFFAIDPALKSEIEGKGMAYRWVNAIKLKANYGYDSRQWAPYKRDSQAPGMSTFSDPEGFIRRGDLILAVQPKAVNSARKAQVASRNKSQSLADRNKIQAEELRRQLRSNDIKADISEGYDDNGDAE